MKYRAEHNKVYTNGTEELMRLKIWLTNKNLIDQHNEKFEAGEVLYRMATNTFTDMTEEEREYVNGFKVNEDDENVERFTVNPDGPAAEAIDYRQKGYVTPVKSQGHCGSCYSFSVTGVMEGQHFKKTGQLVSFSEQQIIDCARHFNTYGCQGGYMNGAYKYILKQGGLDTESSYPYKGTDKGSCRYNAKTAGATLRGFKQIAASERNLQNAVSTFGPISVGIFAAKSFFHYAGGLYYEANCNHQITHAVLVVG